MSRKNPHILIIDDVPDFHAEIRRAFQKGYSFEGAVGVRQLREKLKSGEHFDLFLLDLVLEKSGEKIGLDLIPEIQKSRPGIPIIVVTSDSDYKTVVQAISRGAQNFLYKGDYKYEEWDATFQRTIQQANLSVQVEKLKKENKQLKEIKDRHEFIQHPKFPIIGGSPQVERLRRSLKIAAEKSDLTVMITGETGVGKSIAAHSLHYNSSKRHDRAFEEIFISNIAETMLEAELFGAKKGSYTDLTEDRTGRLELANEGIVFLDEIGDLDPPSQGKLLQFLQKKTIRPLGAKEDIVLDIQVLAATNKIMLNEVAEGRFRKDLYERLKVFPIEIPPLRERRSDIVDLLLHFLGLDKAQTLETIFSAEVLKILTDEYDWTGNVRELENSITTMKLNQELEGSHYINFNCLPDEIKAFSRHINTINVYAPANGDDQIMSLAAISPENGNLDMAGWPVKQRQEFEALQAIERTLILKNGVKGDTAKYLGYNSSDDIRYRIQKMCEENPDWIQFFPNISIRYKRYLPN